MKFRKTRSRSARRSARKTRNQRKRKSQRQSKSNQKGGSIFYDNRVIPDDAYVTEQTDPSSTDVLIKKSELKEIQETI
jgi:UDP-N-acetylenolpyruvoylglucosamine reductase